jgi:MoxR-like ATPase
MEFDMKEVQEIQLEDSELNLKPTYENAPKIFEIILYPLQIE